MYTEHERKLDDAQLCENVHGLIVEKAKQLAYQYKESESNIEFEVEQDEFIVPVKIDVSIENYKYEEETNSASYNVSVFCSYVGKVGYEPLDEYLEKHIYLETIFKA